MVFGLSGKLCFSGNRLRKTGSVGVDNWDIKGALLKKLQFCSTSTMQYPVSILQCTYEDGSQAGIVCVKVVGNRIILARLSGSLDFLELETAYDGQPSTANSPYQRCSFSKTLLIYLTDFTN